VRSLVIRPKNDVAVVRTVASEFAVRPRNDLTRGINENNGITLFQNQRTGGCHHRGATSTGVAQLSRNAALGVVSTAEVGSMRMRMSA